ncbi:hypothetical protein HGB07_03745 [Candidatus Roizmanbacteria bacterium]|nr:hypothetical protein [Candidatus Roizmanbacteria bacterium]
MNPSEGGRPSPENKKWEGYSTFTFGEIFTECREEDKILLARAGSISAKILNEFHLTNPKMTLWGVRNAVDRLAQPNNKSAQIREQMRKLTAKCSRAPKLLKDNADNPSDFDIKVDIGKAATEEDKITTGKNFLVAAHSVLNRVAGDKPVNVGARDAKVYKIEDNMEAHVRFGEVAVNSGQKIYNATVEFVNCKTGRQITSVDMGFFANSNTLEGETRTGNSSDKAQGKVRLKFAVTTTTKKGLMYYNENDLEAVKATLAGPDDFPACGNYGELTRQLTIFMRSLRYGNTFPTGSDQKFDFAKRFYTERGWRHVKNFIATNELLYAQEGRSGFQYEQARAEFLISLEADPMKTIAFCMQVPELLPTLFPFFKSMPPSTYYDWLSSNAVLSILEPINENHEARFFENYERTPGRIRSAYKKWQEKKYSGVELFQRIIQEKLDGSHPLKKVSLNEFLFGDYGVFNQNTKEFYGGYHTTEKRDAYMKLLEISIQS